MFFLDWEMRKNQQPWHNRDVTKKEGIRSKVKRGTGLASQEPLRENYFAPQQGTSHNTEQLHIHARRNQRGFAIAFDLLLRRLSTPNICKKLPPILRNEHPCQLLWPSLIIVAEEHRNNLPTRKRKRKDK